MKSKNKWVLDSKDSNKDGLVDNVKYAYLHNKGKTIALTKKGVHLSSNESSVWNIHSAKLEGKNFKVLLKGIGSKNGSYKALTANKNGVVSTETGWLSAMQAATKQNWDSKFNIKMHLQFKGSKGKDSLIGRTGNDTLNGDLGNDLINGGTGRDTAIFSNRKNASISMPQHGRTLVMAEIA